MNDKSLKIDYSNGKCCGQIVPLGCMIEDIIAWYQQNKRDLPWRNTNDPYKIWLSEIILQQTRVDQGMPYYLRFVEHFPTVSDLSSASEDQVMKLWQGLGYYSRARNLHTTAKYIDQVLKGTFPNKYDELIKLKGVGEYTASAIASFAYEEARPVLDGNVYRVLARYFGILDDIQLPKTKAMMMNILNELIDGQRPSLFNQAMMEFGSQQCKPGRPNCGLCPLKLNCMALQNDLVDQLPKKERKINRKNRFFEYLVFKEQGSWAIRQRANNDIWAQLYEFPNLEFTESLSAENFLRSELLQEFFNGKVPELHLAFSKKHVLTHQDIYARFWEFNESSFAEQNRGKYLFIKDEELMNFAFPRLIEIYFKK